MWKLLILGIVSLVAPAAHAQLDTLPRFEALDKQLQMEEQRRFDELESARQNDRPLSGAPGAGVSATEQALRNMAYLRERDRLLLQAEQDRQRVARERMLAEATLLNRRVPATSTAVVTSPESFILPPAPAGQYYARVEGRFVLVDRASELVTGDLPIQSTDPTADVPAGPRPMPSLGLPLRRVSPGSVLVINDPTALALPAAPAGQLYARVEGRIVLVDARTELPVRVVRDR